MIIDDIKNEIAWINNAVSSMQNTVLCFLKQRVIFFDYYYLMMMIDRWSQVTERLLHQLKSKKLNVREVWTFDRHTHLQFVHIFFILFFLLIFSALSDNDHRPYSNIQTRSRCVHGWFLFVLVNLASDENWSSDPPLVLPVHFHLRCLLSSTLLWHSKYA